MRALFHLLSYHLTRLAAKALFGCVTSVTLVGDSNLPRKGAFILAANHISHFDPPIIAAVIRRKVDWMAMAEFFPHPVLGRILRAIDCLPTDRHRAERRTIRGAIERLKAGRIIGMFPEGGIRDGAASVLEGASLRPGVSALAHIASVAIVPCVILGSDRLYTKANWRPFRRTPVWIAFGEPIRVTTPSGNRQETEQRLAFAFKNLYAELRQKFSLRVDDLPHPPRLRMAK
jgi:1-acyl-sn-glycerol-3-phosphate acyltransferase